jgi:hypothetical protein
MWYQVQTKIGEIQFFVTHMSRPYWIAAFAVACVLGAICLRGFGSRKNY